jgi:hypothetical protein
MAQHVPVLRLLHSRKSPSSRVEIDPDSTPLGWSDFVYSSSLTKFTSVAAPLAAHSVTSEMSTHALQTCEPNMSTIAAASR